MADEPKTLTEKNWVREAIIRDLQEATGIMGYDLGGNDFAYVANRILAIVGPVDVFCALIQGLHAQAFGIHSLGDPSLSHAALADGGEIHDAIHALLRILPARNNHND